MPASDQLERVLEQNAGETPEVTEQGPRMPFETSYILTREQEDELVDHAMKRLEQLENETGRDRAESDWWTTGDGVHHRHGDGTERVERTWMGKRKLYDRVYANDVEHRAVTLGGIFRESNLVVPLARRIVRQMTARAVNYYFSTDPWFAAYPTGDNDREKANKADRYTRWKMDKAGLKRKLEFAVERAFVLGECVVKTTWKKREQFYKTYANVLVDETGADVFATDGDYILDTDTVIPLVVPDPDTGQPIPTNAMVLARDGETPIPMTPAYERKLITRRITHYNGTDSEPLHFMDFLCPLSAPSIQEADCVVHLYDKPVMDIADQWKKEQLENGAEASAESTRKAIELMRNLSSHNGTPKNAQTGDRPDVKGSGGGLLESTSADPVASIAEFYLRYDADGDGIMEEITLWVDRNTRTPIFYDYVANVTQDGLRPFSTIRVNELSGCWYGIGGMEMFETTQEIVDLTVNRWNFANSKSARVDFWNPQNTMEGRSNPHLKLNWGGTYTPINGKTAQDCLTSVYLENNKETQLQEFFQFFMQIATNESGVANSNDAQAAGLETSELATGIRNIEKSGQEMFSLYLGHLEPGIADALRRAVRLLFLNLEPQEIYTYFEEGEEGEGGDTLVRIDPQDIMDMDIDVEVLLSRYRGEQILESSGQAVALTEKFYVLPYEVQVVVAPLFRDMLRALQIKNPDKIIFPTQVAPEGMGGAPMLPTVTPRPREAEPNL
jgi:hypothetical protein